jgi:hypothetical protein
MTRRSSSGSSPPPTPPLPLRPFCSPPATLSAIRRPPLLLLSVQSTPPRIRPNLLGHGKEGDQSESRLISMLDSEKTDRGADDVVLASERQRTHLMIRESKDLIFLLTLGSMDWRFSVSIAFMVAIRSKTLSLWFSVSTNSRCLSSSVPKRFHRARPALPSHRSVAWKG